MGKKNVLFDEWDASMECGSGVVCISGPRGCGKTYALLQYLMQRQASRLRENICTSNSTNSNNTCDEAKDCVYCKEQQETNTLSINNSNNEMQPAFKVLLVSAKCVSTTSNVLARYTEAIQRDCTERINELQANINLQNDNNNNGNDDYNKENNCIRNNNNIKSNVSDSISNHYNNGMRELQSVIHSPYTWRRRPVTHRRRSVSALEFGQNVLAWLLCHCSGSELHCVLDDADALRSESSTEELNLWWQSCEYALRAPYLVKPHLWSRKISGLNDGNVDECNSVRLLHTNKVVLWIISQVPLRIAGCFRYHMLHSPQASCIEEWLQHDFLEQLKMEIQEGEGNTCDRACNEKNGTVSHLMNRELLNCDASRIMYYIMESVKYYNTHQPMRSSVMTHDIRLLLHRVYALLPILIKNTSSSSSSSSTVTINTATTFSHEHKTEEQQRCQEQEEEKLQEEEQQKQQEWYLSVKKKLEANHGVRLNALHLARAWSEFVTTKRKPLTTSSSSSFIASSERSGIVETTNSMNNENVVKQKVNNEYNSKELTSVNMENEIASNTTSTTTTTTTTNSNNNNSTDNNSVQSSDELSQVNFSNKSFMSDPVIESLSNLGYSAILLAFTAFYCGAVPKSKIEEVIGTFNEIAMNGKGKRRRRNSLHGNSSRRWTRSRTRLETTTAQSHRASVLTSSAQVITSTQLLHVYDALLQIVIQNIDPLEFVCSSVVWHFVDTLVKWGLLVQLVHGRVVSPSALPPMLSSESSFRCLIPVNTALTLGKKLCINLYELIPS